VNEHSVFVPLGDERIAAVLCLPETGDALGLWVLMPGQGAPRSTQYHFRFWTELARRLAERGVASIRMDHLGVGDSTRRLEVMAPDPGREQEPLAVAAFGMAAVGTEVLGFAGHCYGGRLAVEAAMVHPRAIGVVASHYAPPVERAAVRPTRRLRYRVRSLPPVARLSTTAFGRRVLEPIVSAVFGRSRGIAGGGERFDAGPLRRGLDQLTQQCQLAVGVDEVADGVGCARTGSHLSLTLRVSSVAHAPCLICKSLPAAPSRRRRCGH
jgi:pimeloyl-ACP methyl ester carboxylesterase